MAQARNAKGGGSIRKRPDGRWEARYTTGRDAGTGKQVQKSVYGKTQTEVRKKLQAACVAIDDGIYIDPVKFTLGTWLDIWLKDYTPNLKPQTLRAYEGHIRIQIKPALGAVKLSALSTHQIQTLYNRLGKGDGDSPALSAKTVKNVHGVLHKALKQAVEMGFIKYNPSEACKIPRIDKPKIKPLEDTEIRQFMQAIKGHKYETFFLLALFTGMRLGELIGLTWDCIDFKNGTIQIYRQLQYFKGGFRFGTLKNGKPRIITPAQSVMKLLQEHKKTQNEWRLKAGTLWVAGDFVFTNEVGTHYAHVTVSHNYKRIVRSLGYIESRFHDLRHSYAVAALQSGVIVKTVQENLGHYSSAFTLDVYGHVSDQMRRDGAEKMEQFIKGLYE